MFDNKSKTFDLMPNKGHNLKTPDNITESFMLILIAISISTSFYTAFVFKYY